jgi:hypothetical protein
MKINYNSWHARLYRHLAGSPDFDWTGEMPKSLYAYFWLSVLVYGITLITLPLFLVGYLSILIPVIRPDTESMPRVIGNFFVGLIYIVAGVLLYSSFAWPITGQDKYSLPAIFGYVMMLLISLPFLIPYLYELFKRRKKEPKEKKPNVLIESLKAIKDKACPIIEWDKSTDK